MVLLAVVAVVLLALVAQGYRMVAQGSSTRTANGVLLLLVVAVVVAVAL